MEENTKKSEKDEVYWRILNSAIELDCKKGHLKWTLSELSRKSKVTRSLIYYYFGRSKIAILDEAVKLVGQEMVGLTEDRLELWKDGLLFDSMMKTRKLYEKSPFLGTFVLENRNSQTQIGQSLLKIDRDFKKKLKKYFTKLEDSDINAMYAVYWGMAFAPGLNDKDINKVIQLISRYL